MESNRRMLMWRWNPLKTGCESTTVSIPNGFETEFCDSVDVDFFHSIQLCFTNCSIFIIFSRQKHHRFFNAQLLGSKHCVLKFEP